MNPFSRHPSTSSIESQQFKATRMWDEIVFAFCRGVPVKRHRRRLRLYDSTFVAKKAVDWLMTYLTFSPSFARQTITRTQVVALLKKFLTHDIIRRIDGDNLADFEDNRDLYRLSQATSCQRAEDDQTIQESRQSKANYGFLLSARNPNINENYTSSTHTTMTGNRMNGDHESKMRTIIQGHNMASSFSHPDFFIGSRRKVNKENDGDNISLISARFIIPSPPAMSTSSSNRVASSTTCSGKSHPYPILPKVYPSNQRPLIDYDHDDSRFWL